jgi:hypothetical protein
MGHSKATSFGYAFVMPDEEREQKEPATSPDYSPDGVDLSLIRWSLSLTPAERLAFLEDRIADILRIRALNAGE